MYMTEQRKKLFAFFQSRPDVNLSASCPGGDVSSEYYGYGGIAKDCGKLYP